MQVMSISEAVEKSRAGSMATKALEDMRKPPKRIATGLPSWDAALNGGLLVPSLTVLGAKPKIGKSTIMTFIADAVVTGGHIVYMVDLENGGSRIFRRIVARRARIAMDEFQAGEQGISKDDIAFAKASAEFTSGGLGSRLFIETGRRFNEADLEQRVNFLSAIAKAEGKEFLLIADSLQKMPVANLSDRRAGIDGWLRFFEYLRDTYEIAILVTSELKRPSEGQAYKPSEISLKESGDIEYSADLVVTLDKSSSAQDGWVDDAPEKSPIQVRVIFNRDGPSGRLRNDLVLEYPYHNIIEVEATIPWTGSKLRVSPTGNVPAKSGNAPANVVLFRK